MQLDNQNKTCGSHSVYRTCGVALRLWSRCKKHSMFLAVLLIWREPKNHYNNCYLCLANTRGYNVKNEKYNTSQLPSAVWPVPYNESLPILFPSSFLEIEYVLQDVPILDESSEEIMIMLSRKMIAFHNDDLVGNLYLS